MVQSVRPQDASGVYRRTIDATQPVDAATPQRTGGPTRARRADTVALSEQGLQLARALEAANAAPEVRAELVDQIKLSVADGTYRVAAGAIALRLLGSNDGEAAAPAAGAQG
jgi:flagellar biosynthesis anti-sigma factor FlgM